MHAADPLAKLEPTSHQRRRRRTVRAAGCVVLLAVAILAPTGGVAPRAQSAPAVAPPVAPQGAELNGGIVDRLATKLIPDQKVLEGAPPTVIDLREVFAETGIVEEGEPLRIEVMLNKKKAAEAEIEGDQLTLTWKDVESGEYETKEEIVLRATNESTGRFVDNKFTVRVWRPGWMNLVYTVIGGLGIFLLGMKSMSDGLQAIAGRGLRRMISLVTDNRFLATGVGTLVTMLVQSSSITTVMVVGFVNSGFMTLSQAIGVIMGANIGTTITGWILVLEIGKYGLPIAGAAAFGYLFIKHEKWRYTAMTVMGLGMVFLGLELMKDGFGIIKDLPEFEAWFARFDASTYLGVLKCASVGCVLTFIVQSSSATLGITIGLAQIGVIPFETAAALVLGENIGTTITAWLASFGASTNARRAAYFHVIFNLFGVAWITAIFIPIYLPIVKWVVGVDPETGLVGNVTEAIAATHTGFNVTNTVFFVWFVPYFARFLERFVPERAEKEVPKLTSLDIRILETPSLAIEQSRLEVMRMAEGCTEMAEWMKDVLASDAPDEKVVADLFHREEVFDTMQDEVVEFMTDLLSGNVTHEIIDEGRRQIRIADECESVSDYLVTILKSHLKLQRSGLKFPDPQRAELLELHGTVTAYLRLIADAYHRRQADVITKAHSQGMAITHRVKELRDEFLAQMSQERVEPQVSVAYTAQLNAYRRVRDHALNVAETMAGEK